MLRLLNRKAATVLNSHLVLAGDTPAARLLAMPYKDLTPPAGDKISINNGKLTVPDSPVIPFIRGDGTGPDIWAASVRVFDAAVEKAYGGKTQGCLVRGLRR